MQCGVGFLSHAIKMAVWLSCYQGECVDALHRLNAA